MPTPARPFAALVALVLSSSLVTACTGAAATVSPSAPPSETAAPSIAPSASDAAFACPPSAQTLEVPSNRLVGVAVTSQSGYDRIVFTFGASGPGSGATPTAELKPAQPPFVKAPSGFPLTVAGDSFLRVTFRETIIADASGQATLQGSTDIKPTGSAVKEVVQAEAFEGLSDWLVGAAAGACARATVDSTAKTLVVDVKAP